MNFVFPSAKIYAEIYPISKECFGVALDIIYLLNCCLTTISPTSL